VRARSGPTRPGRWVRSPTVDDHHGCADRHRHRVIPRYGAAR
jgi:hypothetical protein